MPDPKPLIFVVAAALIDADGRILLAQRPEGKSMAGLWEFPGGKVEAGERPDDALRRELWEELKVDACESCLQAFTFTSHAYPDFNLFMPLWLVRRWDGIPQALEHQALKWVWPKDMGDYPMPPADEPLVAALRDM